MILFGYCLQDISIARLFNGVVAAERIARRSFD